MTYLTLFLPDVITPLVCGVITRRCYYPYCLYFRNASVVRCPIRPNTLPSYERLLLPIRSPSLSCPCSSTSAGAISPSFPDPVRRGSRFPLNSKTWLSGSDLLSTTRYNSSRSRTALEATSPIRWRFGTLWKTLTLIQEVRHNYKRVYTLIIEVRHWRKCVHWYGRWSIKDNAINTYQRIRMFKVSHKVTTFRTQGREPTTEFYILYWSTFTQYLVEM